MTSAQLVDAGFTRRRIAGWVSSGRLQRLGPRTYRLAGAPQTEEQRLLAAVLAAGPGAAASHRSAAAVWGLLDGPSPVVEVTVPYPRQPRVPGAVVHRSRDLAADVVTLRRAIPVTNPLRTLVDLGAVVDPSVVEEALDRALVRKLVSVAAASAARSRLAKPGRSGTGVLRRVLGDRALRAARPDGLLEPRMARLLRDAGVPAAVFQYDVFEDGQWLARVDFAYPDVRLFLEVDGLDSHTSARAFQRDRTRQNALVAAGWTPLRFTWADVVGRPGDVATTISRRLCALGHRGGN